MHAFDVALKDLLQIIRDRKSVLFLVLMPVLFTVCLGFAFRTSGQNPSLPVGWLDRDRGEPLTARLKEFIEAAPDGSSSAAIRLVPLQEAEAERVDAMVRDEKLAAVVIVPAGFSARNLAGETTPLTVIAMPGLPAGQTACTALESASKRLLGAVQAARLTAELIETRLPAAEAATYPVLLEEALAQATTAWRRPALNVALEPAVASETREAVLPSGFAQSSPGMMVQFAIFSLNTSAMVLVLERKTGVLQRLFTTPVRRAEVIAGHVLAMFAVVFLQEMMLIVLGRFLFGVDYMRQPLGTLLMAATLALWAASLGLLIGALSRQEEQVVMWSLIAMFLFSALGGAWFPLAIAGQEFRNIGHLMPTAWAMDGFQNIVVRGLGSGSVLQPAALLAAYAVVFFGLAVWRFRAE